MRTFIAGRTSRHPSAATLRPAGVVLLLFASACATGAPASAPSPMPGNEEREAVVREGVLEVDRESRSYRLYVPASARRDGAPLLVMLHGCTQSAADVAAGTRLNAVAEERGFLVVYPEQPSSAHPQRCWNWYDAAHQGRDRGEPAVIAALTRRIADEHRVDHSRMYVAGISAGAIMAVTVALTYPDLYAAAASHSGTLFGAATDVAGALSLMRGESPDLPAAEKRAYDAMGSRARLIPLMIIHGDSDLVVRPVNAQHLAAQWTALASQMRVRLESGNSERREENGRWISRRTHVRNGSPVLRTLLVEGLGHAWSGGSTEGTYTDPRGPDVTREMVDFLLEHRLE